MSNSVLVPAVDGNDLAPLWLQAEMTLLLGHQTPDDLAAYLHSQGVTGERFNIGSCVLANYLKRSAPGNCAIIVCRRAVLLIDRLAGHEVRLITPLGESAGGTWRHFITFFDSGRYPQLVTR